MSGQQVTGVAALAAGALLLLLGLGGGMVVVAALGLVLVLGGLMLFVLSAKRTAVPPSGDQVEANAPDPASDRLSFDAAVADEQREGIAVAWAVAVITIFLAGGGFAVGALALSSGEGIFSGIEDPFAGTEGEPSIVAGALPPELRASATAAAVATQQAATTGINVTGRWKVRDVVGSGPSAGRIFEFTIVLQQQGSLVAGTGQNMTLAGKVEGETLTLAYSSPTGNGTFRWQALPGGGFSGEFWDELTQAGGPSTLVPAP